MKPTAESGKDPLIDEVRQRRMALYEFFGSDLRTLFEAIQRLQREHPEKIRRPSKSPSARRRE